MSAFNFMSKLFGTTQSITWADTQQLKTTACAKSGVVIGAVDGQPLIDSSMNPVAVLGPCRSGKSASIVVPTLLTWQESAIVTDVQGELHSVTEHWRRTGAHNEVRRLAFGDESSPDTFNFLDAIPRGTPGELPEIQALAAELLHDEQASDAYWHAQSLLMLFILAKRPSLGASLHDVHQAVIDDAAFDATVATFRDIIPGNKVGHAAKTAATAYTELAEDARAGVRATVGNALSIFASPVVARNTMRSSFGLAELRDGKAPMTVYVSFAPHDLGRLQPLIRAFLGQVVRRITQERPQEAAHRLLLVLNDLTALGRLDFLDNLLAHLPGYGIKPLLVIQSLTQLNHAYGENNKVWAQCSIRTVLPVNALDEATAVAKAIAGIDARAGQIGTAQRPAITPGELMRLGKREAIIVGVAAKPLRAATLPYYEDVGFTARVVAGHTDPLLSATTGA